MNRIEKIRQELLAQGKTITNLSSGNSGEFGITFPPEILTKAFQNFQKNPAYSPDPKGNLEARKAVCEFYKNRGSNIDPENILLTSGTSESYLHLFKLLTQPGDEILFPNPSYPLFDHIAKLTNITLNHYTLDADNNWQINLNDLESKITPKTKAIVLISPNNPTGSVLTQTTLTSVLEIAQKHNITIISDEVFSEFIFSTEPFPRLASLASTNSINIFTLNGISKTYALPGLKLSWIITAGPNAAEYIEELELSVDTLLACNQMSQVMLPTIIQDGEPFLQTYHKHLEESRKIAIEVLSQSPNITFHEPQGAFYIFAKIKNYNGTDEDFVIEMLKRENIFVHPGYFYDYEKGPHVLISFVMEANMLREVLTRFVQSTNVFCQ